MAQESLWLTEVESEPRSEATPKCPACGEGLLVLGGPLRCPRCGFMVCESCAGEAYSD